MNNEYIKYVLYEHYGLKITSCGLQVNMHNKSLLLLCNNIQYF